MLSKILEYKKLELQYRRRQVSLKELQKRVGDTEPAVTFLKNFDADLNLICEVKKASPSAGILRVDYDPVRLAWDYRDHGAKALSVLTDEKFFQGHLNDLIAIKKSLGNVCPILRKDFTLHEYHIFEARAFGADAVLLIVAALDFYQLQDYLQIAKELGMAALVEIHDELEWQTAQKLPSLEILGINNRNLQTLETNVETTKRLLPLVQAACHRSPLTVISESGLSQKQTLQELQAMGVHGFLIGESLLKEKKPGEKLQELLKK